MTTRARARRTLVAALIVLLSVAAIGSTRPAHAQSRRTTTTTTTEAPSVPVAPGETAPNGGPLLVPGDVASSDAPADATGDDNTGTVVALVISGLLVVALLLALLTYWFWRNTRPVKLDDVPRAEEPEPAATEG